jgi:hypothetical protein
MLLYHHLIPLPLSLRKQNTVLYKIIEKEGGVRHYLTTHTSLSRIRCGFAPKGKTTFPYLTYFHAAMAAIPVGNIDESAPLPPNAPPINMQFLSLKTKTKLIDILRIIFI